MNANNALATVRKILPTLGLVIAIIAVSGLIFTLIHNPPATITQLANQIPSSNPTSTDLPAPVQHEREQLVATPRGNATPTPTPATDTPGSLETRTGETTGTYMATLGPGAIIFGDFAFTTFNGQLVKIPLTCPSSCPHSLQLQLLVYSTPGEAVERTVSFPLVPGRIAGANQVELYEQAENHERLVADVLFSLADEPEHDSFRLGQISDVGLYLFVDTPENTTSLYLLIAGNSVPAQLGNKFNGTLAYGGQIIDGEPIEVFIETNPRDDLGLSTHNLYAYFPQQNVIQPVFEELVLLGVGSNNQLVVYYPRTKISSPQIGLVTINPVLHGLKGNQIIIAPEDMPTASVPHFIDDTMYFVTENMQIYVSTLTNPTPRLVYDFAKNFRAKSYSLTNWWYAYANNNHPGLCLCSQEQVKKDGSGAFFDLQLQQFIESTADCYGRREVGTWYCA